MVLGWLTCILVAVMLANMSLTVLTVLSNSLERSTEFGLEMFIEECNQICDVYYPECRENSMRGSELTVYSNHQYKEGRIDEYLERIWINYLCETTGCHSKLEGIRFAAKGSFDLLLDPSPNVSRVLQPLFPYRTVKYSIYVRTPEKRFRMFACFYTFSPTLWVVLISSLSLIAVLTLLIHSMPFSYRPVQETLQSLYNLCANNGSTDGSFRSNSSKIIFIVCSTLVLIIWISFSTFLIAELAVTPPYRFHGEVRQFLKGRKLKSICVEPNTAVHARLFNTVQPLVNADPCPVGWPHWLTLLNRVCNSKASRVAFVETSSFPLEYQMFRQTSLPCKLSVIMDNVFQIPKAIMVRRGYPYKEDIGKIFMKVTESGIANLVIRHVYDVIRSRTTEETIQEGYLRISLHQLTVTFSLLAIGAGLAGVIVILEWIAYFRQQRNFIRRPSSKTFLN
ncbi:uncharacterized protein LOC119766489 [Culex quinquefasciatus]|uniref:uncharacterized protein LOC119766489 n=1 Tax=Culex quinquefasciatus TaxID=7176 RepID=UPI0018E3CB20|nr:uncharacterized protein LOC119766489 [Culex quinquefasciatus]